MLNIEQIKNCPLTSQEIYDMINSCLEEAEDNGFLNRFVFERALVCHEVLLLIEDLDELDGPMVAENPLKAFNHFIEAGYVDQLIEHFGEVVEYVGQIATPYYDDYEKYLLSIGGVLNKAEIFSSEVLQNMAGQFNDLTKSGDIQETLKIADEWGMNRKPAQVENPVPATEILDGLFKEQ